MLDILALYHARCRVMNRLNITSRARVSRPAELPDLRGPARVQRYLRSDRETALPARMGVTHGAKFAAHVKGIGAVWPGTPSEGGRELRHQDDIPSPRLVPPTRRGPLAGPEPLVAGQRARAEVAALALAPAPGRLSAGSRADRARGRLGSSGDPALPQCG